MEKINNPDLELDFFSLLENHNFSKKELEKINQAYFLSKAKFKWNKRDSWEDYFEHLVRTASIILYEFEKPTAEKIILSLLHDIVEDTSILFDTIKLTFWHKILESIKNISKKDKNLAGLDSKYRKKEYFERINKLTNDLEIDVKLADRIDNLRTIWVWKVEKILDKISETEKYILPLARKYNSKALKIIEEEIFTIRNNINID